jgi:hypothetical protein
MRCRLIAIAAIGVALALLGAARASSGPVRLQALAAAQTVYLFAHLTGEQTASPKVCGTGQPSGGFLIADTNNNRVRFVDVRSLPCVPRCRWWSPAPMQFERAAMDRGWPCDGEGHLSGDVSRSRNVG